MTSKETHNTQLDRGQIHIMPFKGQDEFNILVLHMDEKACAEFAAGNDDAQVTGFCVHPDSNDEIENLIIKLENGKPVSVQVVTR